MTLLKIFFLKFLKPVKGQATKYYMAVSTVKGFRNIFALDGKGIFGNKNRDEREIGNGMYSSYY